MPSTITALSDSVTMKFKEPYTSSAVNKKLTGIVGHGVVRGGRLETAGSGLLVNIVQDSDEGDSVYSCVDVNGLQFTVRQDGPVTLNLGAVAGTTVYVCLYVLYSIGASTVVEWRTYTEAELFTAPVAEAQYVVILGRVVVPGSGPIPAANVTPERRRVCSFRTGEGMNPWMQSLVNGDFEFSEETSDMLGAVTVLGWSAASNSGTLKVGISTTSPLNGSRHLSVEGTGSAINQRALPYNGAIPVEPGRYVLSRIGIRTASLPVGGASAFYGLELRFFDKDDQLVGSAVNAAGVGNTLSGTQAYARFEKMTVVPATAAWVRVAIRVNTDSVVMSGTQFIFFDEARLWVEQRRIASQSARLGESPVIASEVSIGPDRDQVSLWPDLVKRFVRQAHALVSTLDGTNTFDIFVKGYRGSITAATGRYIDYLVNGSLYAFATRDSATDRGLALLSTAGLGDAGDRQLIKSDTPSHNTTPWGAMRMHVARAITVASGSARGPVNKGWEVTWNAYWNDFTKLWGKDVAALPALKIAFSEHGTFQSWVRPIGSAGTWNDNLGWHADSFRPAFVADLGHTPKSGVGSSISIPGAGLGSLNTATRDFSATDDQKYITIAGATNPANNGTFRVTSVAPTAIQYENPSAVAETSVPTYYLRGSRIHIDGDDVDSRRPSLTLGYAWQPEAADGVGSFQTALNAFTVPKAWGYARVSAGGFNAFGEYNAAATSGFSGSSIEIDFVTPMEDGDYAVVAQVNGSGAAASEFAVVHNQGSGGFRIAVYTDAGVQINLSTQTRAVSWIVFSRMLGS